MAVAEWVSSSQQNRGNNPPASATFWRLKQERENANIMRFQRIAMIAPRRPRSEEETEDRIDMASDTLADTLAASRRVAAAVAAMDNTPKGVAFMDPDHLVWQLADEEEVRAYFEAVLAKVGKASDLPLSELGRGSAAAELIRVATSGDRHNARYRATLAAAVLAQYNWGLRDPDLNPSRALASLCMRIDTIGSGGLRGLGNGCSARDGAFAHLGSGRRQANDGPAWEAAREACEWEMGTVTFRDDPTLEPEERPCFFVVSIGGFCGSAEDEAAVNIENICDEARLRGGVLYPVLGRALLAAHNVKLDGHDPSWGVKVEALPSTLEYAFSAYARAIKEGQEAAASEPEPEPEPAPTSSGGDDW